MRRQTATGPARRSETRVRNALTPYQMRGKGVVRLPLQQLATGRSAYRTDVQNVPCMRITSSQAFAATPARSDPRSSQSTREGSPSALRSASLLS